MVGGGGIVGSNTGAANLARTTKLSFHLIRYNNGTDSIGIFVNSLRLNIF